MYLEISGRRTHKTTRLVRELQSWLSNPFNRAVLITHHTTQSKEISRQINPKYHSRLYYGSEISLTLDKLNDVCCPHSPTVRWFWDEFDSCYIRNVPVMETGYYTTTPRKLRSLSNWENWENDVLLRLLVANDFNYNSRHGMSYFFGDKGLDVERLATMTGSINYKQHNMEYMGHFNDPLDQEVEREKPYVQF